MWPWALSVMAFPIKQISKDHGVQQGRTCFGGQEYLINYREKWIRGLGGWRDLQCSGFESMSLCSWHCPVLSLSHLTPVYWPIPLFLCFWNQSFCGILEGLHAPSNAWNLVCLDPLRALTIIDLSFYLPYLQGFSLSLLPFVQILTVDLPSHGCSQASSFCPCSTYVGGGYLLLDVFVWSQGPYLALCFISILILHSQPLANHCFNIRGGRGD